MMPRQFVFTRCMICLLSLALLVLLSPLGILGGRLLRLVLAPPAGELPGLGLVVVLSLATLAPPGAAVGWTFTALASSASRRWEAGEGIARLYVLESLGSLLGGVAVTGWSVRKRTMSWAKAFAVS